MVEKLDDLVLFTQVVESAGFAAAARTLGLQRSFLSRRIGELEERMGVRLLQRNTRRVSLTPAGERVYLHASVMSQAAKAAFDAAAELKDEAKGTLRITCPVSFASAALMPVIAAFCETHPDVNVIVDGSDRKSDLVGEHFELAFRLSSPQRPDSSLVSRLVGEVPMVVVGEPKMFRDRPYLTHPDQLGELPLLANAVHDGVKSQVFLGREQSSYTVEFKPRLLSSNISILQAGVFNGLGVACLPLYLCQTSIANGSLVDVFAAESGWRAEPVRAYVLMPASRGVAFATRLFLDFAVPRLALFLNPPEPAPSSLS